VPGYGAGAVLIPFDRPVRDNMQLKRKVAAQVAAVAERFDLTLRETEVLAQLVLGDSNRVECRGRKSRFGTEIRVSAPYKPAIESAMPTAAVPIPLLIPIQQIVSMSRRPLVVWLSQTGPAAKPRGQPGGSGAPVATHSGTLSDDQAPTIRSQASAFE
jgi:hypothetical protein